MTKSQPPSAPSARPAVRLGLQIACGVVVAALAALTRTAIDRLLPGSAPFAFFAPAVLLSTLIASWRAGLVTLALILYLAWRFLLAPAGFSFARPGDDATFALQVLSGLLVIFVAQAFRTASRGALAARNDRLAQRDLLMRELDHRVKNTFTLIASMIDVQRRRAIEPAAQEALAQLSTRLQSIAAAHRELYRGDDDVSKIDLVTYLNDLLAHLSGALFTDTSGRLVTDLKGKVRVERDRAVALGLVVNELVTNAAKYARNDQGTIIAVALHKNGSSWVLNVSDNGPGLPANGEVNGTGLGTGLIAAFIKQADAELVASNESGARFELRFRA